MNGRDGRGAAEPVGRPSRLGLVLLVILTVSLALKCISGVRRGGGDMAGYVEVGELVLRGANPYETEEENVNTWPPIFSVASVPLALGSRVSHRLTTTVWAILMAASFYGCVWLSVRLVYGRPLVFRYRPQTISITSIAAIAPVILTWRYVLQNFKWLQINPFILFLALAGCYAITRHRPGRGGAWVGVASAIKVLPVLFVPYFAFKRWWRAMGATIVAGALVTLLPILTFGISGWWRYMWGWIESVLHYDTLVDWGSQSIFAMVDRFVGHQVLSNTHLLDTAVPLEASGDPAVTPIVIAIVLLIVALFALACRRAGRSPDSPEVVVEFAMVMVIIPLVSPTLSWSYYFIFMLLANVVLWRAAVAPVRSAFATEHSASETSLEWRERQVVRVLFAASFAFTTIASAGIVGEAMSKRLKLLSFTTVSALLALAALFYLRAVMGRRSAPARHQSFSTTGSR